MRFLNWLGRFLREHWKLFSLLGLAIGVGITVGLLVAFFPPALPAIAFFTIPILAVTPFLPVLGLSLPAAAVVCAAGAAALTVVAGGIFNAVVAVTNFLDYLIRGPKKPPTDPDPSSSSYFEDEEETVNLLQQQQRKGFNYQKGQTPGTIFKDPSQPRKHGKGPDPDLITEAAPRVN